MSILSKLIEEAGARADSVPVFVIDLLRSLEDRITAMEKALAPAPDTSGQKASAPAASPAIPDPAAPPGT